MRFSELSSRYAMALYQSAKENDSQDKVFEELRSLNELINKDKEFVDFFKNPLVPNSTKAKVITKALNQAMNGASFTEEFKSFINLLTEKGRFTLLEEIFHAYRDQNDQSHGVSRGTVTSPHVLTPEERKQVEDIVSKATNKEVILTYSEDPNLIGGVTAQVGSYTFDDTLSSHLRRLKDHLKRRAH